MKNLEKLVPVAVAGLVLASTGSINAQAAEAQDVNATPATPADPSEVAPTSSENMNTTISSVTPAPNTGSDSEDSSSEDAGSENDNPVADGQFKTNVDFDFDGDGNIDITSTGDLNVNVTPQDPVTDPETGSITNSDQVVITTPDGIEANKPGDPFTEDQDKVDEAKKDSETKDEQSDVVTDFNRDKFEQTIKEQFGDDVKFTDINEGLAEGTTGFTFETSQTVDKALTESERETVLDAIMANSGITKNAEGQYVNASGQVVTVSWGADNSTVTNTTTWTVTITEVPAETEEGNVSIGGSEGSSVTIPGSSTESQLVDAFIQDILDDAKKNPEKYTVVEDEDAKTTTITYNDGANRRQHVITVTETPLNAEDLAKTSNEDLVTLLGSGYKLKDGKIVTNDDNEYEVSVDTAELNGTTVLRTVTTTIYSKSEDQSTMTDEETTDATTKAVEQAVSDAVAKALEAADAKDWSVTGSEQNGDVWTVTVKATVGGVEKEFTYKVVASSGSKTDPWSTEKVAEKDVVSGSTTTVTGEAHVSGETITWSGSETSEKVTVTVDEETKEVSFDVKAEVGKEFDGAVVESVTKNDDGSITVVTKANGTDDKGQATVTTKTYIFTLGTMTDAEKKDFLEANGATEADELTGLSKVTWTIDETVVTEIPGTEEKTETTKGTGATAQDGTEMPEGVSKDDAGYHYQGVTLTKDESKSSGTKSVYTYTSEDGKTTYVIEETQTPLSDGEIEALIKANYTAPEGYTFTKIEGSTAIYTNATTKQTITVNFTTPTKTTVNLTTTITSPQFESTLSKEDVQKQITEWAKAQADKYGSIQLGGQTITSKMDLVEIGKIVETLPDNAINKDVDFTEITGDKLKETLDGLEQKGTSYMPDAPGSTYGQYVWSGTELLGQWWTREFYGVAYIKDNDGKWYQAEKHQRWGQTWYEKKPGSQGYAEDDQSYINIPIPADRLGEFNTELGHIDLVADSTLTTDDGDEDCILLEDVTITLSKSSQDMVDGKVDKSAELKNSIDWDNQDGLLDAEGKPLGFWQYDRKNGLSQDYVGRDNKFYKVTGTVAYGLVDFGTDEAAAQAAVNAGTILGFRAVPKVVDGKDTGETVYKGYTKTAILTTYGYLGAENNACHNDYDIKIGNLKLLKGGEKVTSVNEEVEVFSAKVTATSTLSSAINKLIFGDIVTTTPGTDGYEDTDKKDQITGSALSGAWTIKQEYTENDFKETDPVSGEQTWKYDGSDGFSYDTYKTWLAGDAVTLGSSTATNYAGTLGYTYETAPAGVDVSISGTTNAVRNINATVTTSTTTTPTTERPTTPTPPTGGGGGGGTGGGGGGDTTIDDEDVPLAQDPEVETPEIEIPEDDVPLAQDPEVEIEDEEVPLADVPQTGDNFLLEALSLALSSASGLWLGLSKKRRS